MYVLAAKLESFPSKPRPTPGRIDPSSLNRIYVRYPRFRTSPISLINDRFILTVLRMRTLLNMRVGSRFKPTGLVFKSYIIQASFYKLVRIMMPS